MFETWIHSHREEIIGSLQKLLRIPSVGKDSDEYGKPFGEETHRALQYMLELGKSYGCNVRNVDGYAGHIEIGDGDEYVAVLAHLDVVPAGTGWTYPPFGAEIHDGKIFGRGALDDKGPAIAALYAMLAVKSTGFPLKKRVRLILGLDEETDWRCVEHYFKKEPLPWGGFTPDADFPLISAEKGILQFSLSKTRIMDQGVSLLPVEIIGGERPNMVPSSCSATLIVPTDFSPVFQQKVSDFCSNRAISYVLEEWEENLFSLTVFGRSAHGSTPDLGVNAITNLAAVLAQFPVDDRSMWEFLASSDIQGKFLGIGCSDNVTGHLSCNLGMLEANDKFIRLVFDVRYPVDRSGEELLQLILQTVSHYGFRADLLHEMKPLYVPEDSPVVATLRQVYHKITGEPATPFSIGGGTYARAIPNAVAFGPLFPGMEDVAHQKDEYIAIDHLLRIASLYAHAIYELAK